MHQHLLSGHPIQNPGYNCAIMNSGVQYFWQTMSCSKKLGYICHKTATLPIQAEGTWISYYVTICVSFFRNEDFLF